MAETPIPNDPPTGQPPPRDKVAFMAEARRRFQRCIDATETNRKYQFDDLKFAAGSPDNGWQWPAQVLQSRQNDRSAGGPRPTLTNNRLGPHIRLVTNEQRKNKPAGKVLPVDGKSDPEVAEVLNGVIRHIHVASHADVAHDTACESQVTIGEGYWRIVTDYCNERSRDQDIRIQPIKNSFSVYLDPDSLKQDSVGRLCEYGFITQRLPTQQYKADFPDAKSRVDWDDLQLGDDVYSWFDDEGVTISEYFYVEKRKAKLVFWSDGSATIDDEMPKHVGLLPDGERETTLRSVKWCKVNGIEVLEETDWLGKYIPIVRIVGNEWDVEGELVTAGIVRNAKDPQRMINYWDSQEAEMLALAPKAPFIGAVGQFVTKTDDWRDANIKNLAYLEYDPHEVNGQLLPPPQRVGPPMAMIGIIEAKRAAADALQAVIGQYNPSLGADAKEKSGIAIRARQQQADMGTYHYQDNLARGIEYETEILLDLIPKVIDTRRVVRIIGEDGEPDTATMNVGQGQAVIEEQDEAAAIQKIYDPSVGTYDVTVSTGPSFQTKRQEAAEFLTQAAQAAKDPVSAQVLSWLALKSQDWPEADEAADMLKKLLPPQVLPDSDDPNNPAVKEQQLQAAAQALGQREAAVNQATDEIQQASEEAQKKEQAAKDAEMRAKEATARAQAKVDEINSAMQTLQAERELFAMQQKLAQKEMEIERTTLQADKDCLQAECKALQLNMDKKLGEINAANENNIRDESAKSDTKAMVDGLMDALKEVCALATADREIVLDENGEPTGSRIVMQPKQSVQ